jgi:predicted NBD/HSP70 family sugar kinase
MEHFAGLDVSVKDTSVCIVDDTGKIVREVKVASEPAALLAVLKNPAYRFKRIVTSTQRSSVCHAGILGSARARIALLKRGGCPTCPFPGCLA